MEAQLDHLRGGVARLPDCGDGLVHVFSGARVVDVRVAEVAEREGLGLSRCRHWTRHAPASGAFGELWVKADAVGSASRPSPR